MRRLAVLGALAALSVGAALGARSARRTPSRAALGAHSIPPGALADQSAADCGACHEATHARWRDSMHAASYTDPFFQAGYRVDPEPFCRACHAPRAPVDAEPRGVAAADGVDCVTCHVRAGRVLASHVTAAGESAHPMRLAPELTDERACVGCHEFRFPPGGPFSTHAFMQRTVQEWRDEGSGRTCQSCHMPGGEHRVLGLRDDAFVRSALTVEFRASREGADTLTAFGLEVSGAAHAVPTGDLFRQLELTVWPDGAPDRAASIQLGRHFGPPPASPGPAPLIERADHRVAPGSVLWRTVRLAGEHRHVSWRLDLLRVDARHARHQGIDPERGRVAVAEGSFEID